MTRRARTLTIAALAVATALSWPVHAQAPLLLVDPQGGAVDWWQWLSGGPTCAVVVWSSWVPDAESTAARFDELRTVSARRGMRLVVVDTQEPFADAAEALRSWPLVPWLHDRHGAMLKHYRVTRLPALLMVAPNGQLSARLDPTPEALTEWASP